jgi:hypothetical protein
LTPFDIADSYLDFFTNPYADDCGLITSGSLYNEGCTEPYTTGNLEMDSSTGYITAAQNIVAGYVDIVCIKCQNLAGSVV